MHTTSEDLADWRSVADPYQLDPAGVREPPDGWWASLRHLGPGMILSASIVGSGELIATTTAGAQAGFVLLWLVLFSCAVKVAVQIEFARWTIATGTPALSGYNRVPPRVGRLGWINVLFAVMVVSKVLQIGGIVGGAAIACSILLPLGSDPLEDPSRVLWHVIVIGLTIGILHTSRYRLVERGAIVLVVVFSVMTVAIAVGLPFTSWGYSLADIASGLTFQIPPAALGAAVAMFGITGVGADEITMYNYWCIEKGYARFAGPNDGSDAWLRRARGWIRVMYRDAILSMVVYTFSTVAFFIMGAAVLHRQGLVPQGNEMITTLARMYTDAIGTWAMALFLVGAVAVLGSTLWASVPSHSRMYANWMSMAGVFDWRDRPTRIRWVRGFGIVLPIVWGTASLVMRQPVLMVQIGGVMTGIFLLAVLVATWYLRRTEIDRRLYGGTFATLLLVLSTIAIGILGAYTALSTLGLVRVG
ncbi:MAG: Nramp family divalent metal transporter [Acidobacteriota bacterium]|jgi:Mn2+/Fe2+ NRAMP family transporter|nr:MAG: manganese transporter [Acidobacteriota bacterium]